MEYTIIYHNGNVETYEPCASKDYAVKQVAKYKKETGKYAQWVYTKLNKLPF